MKTLKYSALAVSLTAVCLLVSTSCSLPLAELAVPANSSGSATIYLSVAGSWGSRTLMPDVGKVAIEEFVIEGRGPGVGTIGPVNFPASSVIELEDVLVGEWTLTVAGLDSESREVAQGSKTVIIQPSGNDITIDIRLLQTASGSLSVTVAWPQSAGIDLVEAKLGANPTETVSFEPGSAEVTYSKLDLSSGFYDLALWLKSGTKMRASVFEVVHIYDYMTTEAFIEITEDELITPRQPMDVTAVSVSENAVEVRWDASSVHTETGFEVHRDVSADFGSPMQFYVLPANTDSYVDTTVTVGTTYYYRVAAVNDFGRSAWVVSSAVTPSANPNLTITSVYLNQAIQTSNSPVPIIAGRDGLLRVFVQADRPNTLLPEVRVRFYRDGAEVDSRTIAAPAASVPLSFDESSLSASWNVVVPGSVLVPELSITVEVDPDNEVFESVETDNVFSSLGLPYFDDVREVPVFRARLVPIYQSAFDSLGDVTEANRHGYLDLFRRIYPVAETDVEVADIYTTSAVTDEGETDWYTIIMEIGQLRLSDESSRYYYGVLKRYGGPAGVGYVGGPVAIGYDSVSDRAHVYAHELGHNLGLWHSPAGDPDNTGSYPNYPYPGGNIGHWGWDSAENAVVPPSRSDIMGYSRPAWSSDYTYRKVLDFRDTRDWEGGAAAATTDGSVLVLWGRVGERGISIQPAYLSSDILASGPEVGPYLLEGLDESGNVLFTRSFSGTPVTDGEEGQRHFVIAVPAYQAQAPRLATIRVSGEGNMAEIRSRAPGSRALDVEGVRAYRLDSNRVRIVWDGSLFPMAVVRNPTNSRILSFARGGDVVIVTPLDELVLDLSDGARSTTHSVTVER